MSYPSRDFSYYIFHQYKMALPMAAIAGHTQKKLKDDMLGQLCYIGYLRAGQKACIHVVLKSSPEEFKTLLTLPVKCYKEYNGGNCMEIKTEGGIYTLRRATTDEISVGLSMVKRRRITTPVKDSGYYGT